MFKLPFLKTKYFQPRFLMVVFLVVIVGFFFAGAANASISSAVATFLGWIVYGIVWALGQLLVLMMEVLAWVAQWNNFINAPAVVLGWKIVRDICNMFFVVIMLIIAFATILRVKEYSYEKLLPKLIIMAILINFSKMICGLLIDVSQVVMLTFVNSFKDVAGANLTTILGLDKLTSMGTNAAAVDDKTTGVTSWSIMGAYVLALVYVIIALITIVTMVIMLAIRIVMIWIYVVLSPMAYLLGAFPAGKKYSSKWWHDFTSNLIVGPILAFFIWLSFAALGTGQDTVGSSGITAAKPTNSAIIESSSETDKSLTQAGSPDNMLNFVISIAMLYGGLTIAKSVGGAAGDMAGKGMGAISKGKGMAISGIKSGARSTAYGAIANKRMAPITKNVLGTVAATGGVRGKILGAVGVRGLAGKGLIAFNQQQKKVEDKAKKKIESFKDTRVVARYAREKAFTPLGIAAQKKAANMMPSALYDPANPASVGKVEKQLAGMGKDDVSNLTVAEWHAIGRTGAQLNSRALSYVEKNSEERGAYNVGLGKSHPGITATPIRVAGTDKNGNRMTTGQIYGVYAHQKDAGILDADVESTLERSGSHSTQYFREENSKPKTLEPEKEARVSEEDQESPRGKGNLSVNEIARGTSSTAAVDFDKLNLPEINKGNDADYRNTRGFNTSDQDLVGKIASKMLEVISQEKDQLLSKKSLEPGDQKRLASLNKAEEYFKAPEKIDNLSMLNSSAAKFKVSDVKETKIHEEIHGLGYGEDDARSVTGSIMKNKNYSARHNRGEIDSILTENNQQSGVAKKSSQEVEQEQDEAELELDKSPKIGDARVDTNELNKAIENFSQKISEVAKTFSAVGQSKSVSSNSMNSTIIGRDNFSLFRNLGKIIKSSNNDIANKISILGGTKAQSPLELDVIYKEIDSEK